MTLKTFLCISDTTDCIVDFPYFVKSSSLGTCKREVNKRFIGFSNILREDELKRLSFGISLEIRLFLVWLNNIRNVPHDRPTLSIRTLVTLRYIRGGLMVWAYALHTEGCWFDFFCRGICCRGVDLCCVSLIVTLWVGKLFLSYPQWH